jgi:DNA-binding transcriptional regulator YhcF (GntR family)
MEIHFESEKPIYLQIAEQLEEAILSGAFPEETQIPSTTEISITFKINPATALKGINLLVDADIIYKKRGLGMFVKAGAKNRILEQHKQAFYQTYIVTLLSEAKTLKISKAELLDMIERGYEYESPDSERSRNGI